MLKESVEKVIEEQIRPGLVGHGGNIELVNVTDNGEVHVRLQGACAGCPGAMMTLQMGVQRVLQQHIKEVSKVVPVR